MLAVLLPVSFKVCAGKTTTENAGDILLILLPLTRIFHGNAGFWGNLSVSVLSIRRKA